MKKRICISAFLVLFVLSSFLAIANMPEKEKLSLEEIIAKNIEAHGGKEKIAAVKTVSFNIPNPRDPKVFNKVIATSDGNLKSINEVNGFTWRVTTVKDSKVQSVRYPADSSIENDEKVSLQCLALLSSGAYTVKNFRENLQFKGIKKYGPLKFYLLTADKFGHSIEFYIDAADFLLKRIIIKGGNDEEGKYQTVYEISEFQDAAGLKVPKTMLTSYIGSRARNQANQTIADFKIK